MITDSELMARQHTVWWGAVRLARRVREPWIVTTIPFTQLVEIPPCLRRTPSDNQQELDIDLGGILQQLSDAELAALVTALESFVYPARRPRMLVGEGRTLSVQLCTLDPLGGADGASFVVAEGRVRDVGDAGIGLISSCAIEAGRRVLLEIDLRDGQRIVCKGLVAWSESDRHGGGKMGIAFEEPQIGLLAHVAFGEEALEAQRFA
jgi:hypothetical protein